MIIIISLVTVVHRTHLLGVAQPSCSFHSEFLFISRHTFVVCMAAFWPTCWIHDSSFSRVFLFLSQHFFFFVAFCSMFCDRCASSAPSGSSTTVLLSLPLIPVFLMFFFYSGLSFCDATYTSVQILCFTYDRCG